MDIFRVFLDINIQSSVLNYVQISTDKWPHGYSIVSLFAGITVENLPHHAEGMLLLQHVRSSIQNQLQ